MHALAKSAFTPMRVNVGYSEHGLCSEMLKEPVVPLG